MNSERNSEPMTISVAMFVQQTAIQSHFMLSDVDESRDLPWLLTK